MYCSICGDEANVLFYEEKRCYLCPSCAKDTPAKLPKSEFEQRYWDTRLAEVPPFIRREFYEDYLSSCMTFEQYKEATTSGYPEDIAYEERP